jgi:hypothetical protein
MLDCLGGTSRRYEVAYDEKLWELLRACYCSDLHCLHTPGSGHVHSRYLMKSRVQEATVSRTLRQSVQKNSQEN